MTLVMENETPKPSSDNALTPEQLAHAKLLRKRELARERQRRWQARLNPEQKLARNLARRERYNRYTDLADEGERMTLTMANTKRIFRDHPSRIAKWQARKDAARENGLGFTERYATLWRRIIRMRAELREAAVTLNRFHAVANITDPFPEEWTYETPPLIVPAQWYMWGPAEHPPHEDVMWWFLSEADALAHAASEQAVGRGPWTAPVFAKPGILGP